MPVSLGPISQEEKDKNAAANAPARSNVANLTPSPLAVPTSVAPPPASAPVVGPTAATQTAVTAKAAAPVAGAPSASNGFGDQSSLMPQTSGQAGTGYVNLSRVLGANLGAGDNVLGATNDRLQKEFKGRFAAEDAYTKGRGAAVAGSALNSNAFSGPARSDIAPSLDELKKGVTGLDVEKFSRGTSSDEMSDLAGLGNSATAGRVLAKDAGVTGQYAPKLSALDALIYGGNSAAGGAVEGAKTAAGEERKNAAASAGTINNETARLNKTATDAAEANRQKLRDSAAQMQRSSEFQADAVNRANAGLNPEDYADMASGLAPVQQANAGQFIDQGMVNNSQTIADVLGDPSLAMRKTGTYDNAPADAIRKMADWRKEIQGKEGEAAALEKANAEPKRPSAYDFRAMGVIEDGNGGYRTVPGAAPLNAEGEAKLQEMINAKAKHDQWLRDHPQSGNIATTSRSY